MKIARIFTLLFILVLLGIKPLHAKKDNPTVFLFGVASSFNDTVVYITDIQPINGILLQKHTGFLPGIGLYSQQLKSFFQKEKGMPNRLCTVFFGTSEKKLRSKVIEVRKSFLEEKKMKVMPLLSSEFQFKWVGEILENIPEVK